MNLNWRDGRVVDYTGLENRRTERYRGFESLSLRYQLFAVADQTYMSCEILGALVQLVRISPCHGGGHGFESRTHRNILNNFYCEKYSYGQESVSLLMNWGSTPLFRSLIFKPFIKFLSPVLLYGVMVARKILVLLVWVRVLVEQQ